MIMKFIKILARLELMKKVDHQTFGLAVDGFLSVIP